MKNKSFGILLLGLIISCSSILYASENKKYSYNPTEGYVPNELVAIKIAEAVLVPIYGEEKINEQKPLTARLENDIWIVEGILSCPPEQRCLGGVAVIEISKADGKILRVSHGK